MKRNPKTVGSALALGVAIAAQVLAPSVAGAGGAGIVLESRTGPRAKDTPALLGPVQAALGRRGYVTSAKLAAQVEASLSQRSDSLSPGNIATARRLARQGRKAYINGRFEAATKSYAGAIKLLMSAPATMARDQSLRAVLADSLIGLGLTHKRLGHTAQATRPVAELLRSMPDRELSRSQYGPDAHDLYRQVKRGLTGQGLGRLRVDAGDAMVFVNERFIGVGKVSLKDMLPGLYRVYTQRGDVHGRIHSVSVEPGVDKVVSVGWRLDAALRTDSAGASLQFGTAEERTKLEGKLAMRVARGVGASSVVVVGLKQVSGRRMIVGRAYSMDSGSPVREGRLAVEPVAPSQKKLRALGLFLAGDESLASMFAPTSGEPVVRKSRRAPSAWYADKVGWGITGGGVLALGAGVGFLASAAGLDDKANNEPLQLEAGRLRDQAASRRTWGTALSVAGGIGLAAGIVKLIIHPSAPTTKRSGVSLVIAPNRFVLSGRF